MVSDLNYESQLALHVKRCKVKQTNSKVCFEKCNFLQTVPNISNIYIYIKLKLLKYWSRIRGPYLKNHLHLARKPQFYGGNSPKKLRFIENNGYGWIDLGMLSSKLVELARKLARDGRKMAKTAAATQTHPAVYSSRRSPSEDETLAMSSSATTLPLGSARVR